MNPSRLAVFAVASAAGLTLAAEIAKGRTPKARIIIGATVAAVLLSTAAGVVPGIVRGLSVLIILGALLGPGYSLAQPLTKLVS